MHRITILLLLLASCTFIEANNTTDFQDTCNPPCTKYGSCISEKTTIKQNGTKITIKEYKCDCNVVYEGKDCGTGYNEDLTWRKAFLAYSTLTAIANLACGLWGGYEIWVTLRFAEQNNWSKWSVVTVSLGGVCIGCLLRVLEFSIDPHAVRKIFSLVGDEVIFTLPLVIWMSCAYSLFLYWIELHILTGVKQIQFARRLRPALYVLIVLNIGVMFPTAVVKAVQKSSFTGYLYNIFFAFFLFVFVVVTLVYGTKLKNHMKRIYDSTNVQAYGKFLVKMSIFIYIITMAFTIAAISIIAFQFFGKANKWIYISFHSVFRAEEIVILVTVLYFFHKKAPKRSTSTESKETPSARDKSVGSTDDKENMSLDLSVVEVKE